MLKLVIEDGEGTTHVVPIIRDKITIGREEGNTIRLTERNVSRHHARLTRSTGDSGSTVILEDLASYNGIRVNGALVKCKQTLIPDDTMQIGDYFIVIEADEKNTVVSSAIDTTATEMERTEELNPVIEEDDQGRLVVVSSNLAGTCYWLNRREMLIGRSDVEGNDVVVKHRSISRHHAKMIYRDKGYTLVDLASSNGVLVNSVPSGTTSLVNGDIIEMGHVKLRYCAPGDSYVFQMADIDDVVVVSRGSNKKLFLTVLILTLIMGTSYYLTATDTDLRTNSRRSPSNKVQNANKTNISTPATRSALLTEARRWAEMKEWKTASGVCARLVEDTALEPSMRLEVTALQKRVNQETINLERLERLKALDVTLDDETALSAELPTTDSVYAEDAMRIMKRVRKRSINTLINQFELNLEDGELNSAQEDLTQLRTLKYEAIELARLQEQLEREKDKAQEKVMTRAKRLDISSKSARTKPKSEVRPDTSKRKPTPADESQEGKQIEKKPQKAQETKSETNPEAVSQMKKSRLKFLEDAWRIAASDKSTPRRALHKKSKQLCNLTDEMNLRDKAITYCTEQAKYEKNIQIKRGLERKVQKWKQ